MNDSIHPALLLALATLPECARSPLLCTARRFAQHTNGAGHDFEDLVMEGIPKVRTALETYSKKKNVPLTAYIRLLLSRHYISLGRRRRNTSMTDVAPLLAPREACAERLSSLRLHVHDAIDNLLPDDPQGDLKACAFSLYHLANFTLAELAQLFGMSIGTIWRWMKEAEDDFKRVWTQNDM